jgi:hypothetical protein
MPIVADVLSEKNFSGRYEGITHSEIYLAAKELYPSQPIDLKTAFYCLRKTNKAQELGYYLGQLTLHIQSSSNTRYHAYVLLEIDLHYKFIQLLADCKHHYSGNDDVRWVFFDEILDAINFGRDLFETIYQSIAYFKKMDMQYAYDELVLFEENIAKKVTHIKKSASIYAIVQNIGQLPNILSTEQYYIKSLANAIAQIAITGKVNTTIQQAVSILEG